MTTLTTIPNEMGSGGAHLAPDGAAGSPTLKEILEEHKAAIEGLSGSAAGAVIVARAATTADRSLTGLTNTNLDGVTPVAGDVILVRANTDPVENGLYVAAAGAWTRMKDSENADVLKSGLLVQVEEGSTLADKLYALTTNDPFVVGTDAIAFAESTAKGAVATTSAAGLMSAADKAFLDSEHEAAGTAIGDADGNIAIAGGKWRVLATLSGNRSYTLQTTGAVAGDQITVTRTSTAANTAAFINGGPGAGTLLTMPNSKVAFAKFQFDGTNWALREVGVGS